MSEFEQFDLLELLQIRPKAYKAFLKFHEANPGVYEELVARTREWKRATGRTRVGFPMIWESARYDRDVKTTTTAPKLNNNLRSYYARYIMLNEPDLAGAYEIRDSPADVIGRAA